MQRTTLNNLEDDEHELQKYVIGYKQDNYGIKQRPNFHTHTHTHTHNSLSVYWQGDLSNVNDNNEWYNS